MFHVIIVIIFETLYKFKKTLTENQMINDNRGFFESLQETVWRRCYLAKLLLYCSSPFKEITFVLWSAHCLVFFLPSWQLLIRISMCS